MEQRRFLNFIVTATLFTFIWLVIGPKLFPGLFPQQVKKRPQIDPVDVAVDDGEANVVKPIEPSELTEFPQQEIKLGSLDPASGYMMQVVLTSTGASIDSVALNGPKFTKADDRAQPLKPVGNAEDPPANTFAIESKTIDPAFAAAGESLARVDWEVVQGSVNDSSAAFRYPLPNGLELLKSYRIEKSNNPEAADGYIVHVDLKVRNTAEAALPLQYYWQGPVGAPLEGLDSAITFIELKSGFLPEGADNDADVNMAKALPAGTVINEIDANANFGSDFKYAKPWRSELVWAGVDVQFFASLVMRAENARSLDFIEQARPVVVERRPRPGGFFSRGPDQKFGDVSLQFDTKATLVEPGEQVQHELRGYFGPKRLETLREIHADDIIAFGWFGWISKGLLSLLGFFHDNVGLPYAFAIVLLTCCVRLCLMPVTLKAAASAKKMKDLQPKIEELKQKHGDDKEALGRAQMELMMKEGNPLGGCLPLFLQMPIFIGLYQALRNAVDLRMAQFLWADNLAAPDHLASLGFKLPFLGTSWFNLFPLVVVCLFLTQQKLFMPPAVSEEQKQQYKIMNFMMVFMGFLFYSVPAGLCLYFMASSLWGITERTAIDKGWIKLPDKKKKAADGPRKEGPIRRRLREKFEELQAQADEARSSQQGQIPPTSTKRDKSQERRIESRRQSQKTQPNKKQDKRKKRK